MKTLEQITLQEEAVANLRAGIVKRELEALTNSIVPFFSEFTPGVDIEVFRNSVYFKMDHPEYSYKKELFSIYLRDNWSFVGEEKYYTGIDLSYYSTSVKGVDAWELKRLQMLGKVAEIIHDHQDLILARINSAVAGFRAELDEVYEEMHMLNQERSEVQNAAYAKRRMEVIGQLCGRGVVFNEGVGITLKRDYTLRVGSIKVQSVSKSEKTCTVIGILAHGGTSFTEERVDFERLITQVIAHQNIQSS